MPRKKDRRVKRIPSSKPSKIPPLTQALVEGLEEVDQLARRKDWRQAFERLQALNQRFPNRPQVLGELVNVCYELKDLYHYLYYCEQLHRLRPHDPDVMPALAGAYLSNEYMVLALQTFRRFLSRYPDHPRAADARTAVSALEKGIDELLAQLGIEGEEGLELAALHDTVRLKLAQGQYRRAREAAHSVLQRHPDFIPVINNLSQVDFADGRHEQAIAAARRVLELDPDNVQAHANLTRYLFLSGRIEEAHRQAERLKQIEANIPDNWVKKAEALTYLGDDKGVLTVFHQAEAAGYLDSPALYPLFYHYAAVAALRLGDETRAQQYWHKALEINPHLALARDNLADLERPVHERHAPWPFSLGYWISRQSREHMVKWLKSVAQRDDPQFKARIARNYLKQHPELIVLMPVLLERGDPIGRQFALQLATMAKTPELLALLRDFVLGQRGPDGMRLEAAQVLSNAGVLPAGPIRLWIRGEWKDIQLLGFEIHGEPTEAHAPELVALLKEAGEALRQERGGNAEKLLNQALEVEPNAPDILNNLAMAYEQQGRHAEAVELIKRNHREHPDYFFGRVSMALIRLEEGDSDQAEELLKPLLTRRRMHYSEFHALSNAYIQVCLAKGQTDAAHTWLDLWAGAEPDHPQVLLWRKRLGKRRFA